MADSLLLEIGESLLACVQDARSLAMLPLWCSTGRWAICTASLADISPSLSYCPHPQAGKCLVIR